MGSRAKLALTSAALSFAVILPFAAKILVDRPAPPRATSWDEISEFIASRDFELAYRLLQAQERAGRIPILGAAHASYQKSVCERGLGRPELAYVRLARLQGVEPLLEDYRRLWMARSLQEMGDAAAATAAYEDLLISSAVPAVADSARLYLAALYAKADQFDRSLELYRAQIERDSRRAPDLLFRIAQIHDAADRPQRARRARLQLMEAYPSQRPALDATPYMARNLTPRERHARGLVYLEHGRSRQAAKEFGSLLKASPDHSLAEEAHYLLARAYLKLGQFARARRAFEKVHERYGRPAALYRLAGIQVRLDRDREAIDTYSRFVSLYPRHELAPRALWQAAKAAERYSDFDDAERIYRQLVENYPHTDYSDEASWSVAFMRYCLRQYDEALRLFREVAGRAEEPHIVDQSLFWAGKTAQQMGQSDAADRFFSEAAGGFPRSYYSTRAVRLGYGANQTLRQIQTALGIGATRGSSPASWDAKTAVRGRDYLERADLLVQLGLRSRAEVEMRDAEELNEGDVGALRAIRDCYESLGILDRALVLTTRIFAAEEDEDEICRLYPSYYWEQIVTAAREAQVDPYLVLSVMRQESFFNDEAVSRAGAVGLMQIMPQTGKRLARLMGVRPFDRRLLFDPDVSIRMGSRFLADQVRSFTVGPTREIGFELGLAAYNAGPHVARQWIERFPYQDPDAFVERIPYRETRLYVKRVLRNYTIYKTLSRA